MHLPLVKLFHELVNILDLLVFFFNILVFYILEESWKERFLKLYTPTKDLHFERFDSFKQYK